MAALGQVYKYNNIYLPLFFTLQSTLYFVGAKEFSFINYDGYIEEDKVQSIELE